MNLFYLAACIWILRGLLDALDRDWEKAALFFIIGLAFIKMGISQ